MSALLEKVEELIDSYNINLVNIIFLSFTVVIVIFGSLINLIEDRLPNSLRQSFRYGKHSHKGANDALVSRLELPKGWFSHFYVFAFSWSMLALFLLLKGLIMHAAAPEYVLRFLDFMAGGAENRKVQVNSTYALMATVLLTLQCARRFYETNFVQIFSKKSKINLSHYFVGYIHYFGAILALLTNTEGFVRGELLLSVDTEPVSDFEVEEIIIKMIFSLSDSLPSGFAFNKINLLHYMCIFLFHFAWSQQYKSNMILVNLRKDAKTGKVATESHLLPQGGFFNLISSPHMFFEVVMYVVLWGLLAQSTTWRFVVIWVISNQVCIGYCLSSNLVMNFYFFLQLMNALLTHKWYNQNFKNYPKKRKAFIPFLL